LFGSITCLTGAINKKNEKNKQAAETNTIIFHVIFFNETSHSETD
jgi:hypothetical protein